VSSAAALEQRAPQLGRYALLSEIGQGAMGVVYKARDPVIDRIVAIKTINLTLPRDELGEYEARFYQEARAAGGLNHPNIVIIYDIGRSERVAYMAMELLEGEELRSILSDKQALPVALALDIARQVAEGLAYAHERHVIHRDIKPANIMIVRDGLVKITDFGIARMRTNEVKTMTGMILGSPKYMSPEQIVGKAIDHRSDIFSLGVVLYEMLTGEAPFLADSVHGVMYQVLNFTPQPPSARNARLPALVDLIVAKALNKNPEQRYDDVKDLAHDLRQCMEMMRDDPVTPTLGPAPTARSEHRVQTAASANALAVAPSFDSLEATMRLAGLTGADTQRLQGAVQPGAAPSTTAVGNAPQNGMWRNTPNLPGPGGGMAKVGRYAYLWIASTVAFGAAIALFLLAR